MPRPPRHRRRRDDGATLIEFAFIAMPLCLIVFAMIELGWAFFTMSDVRHASREGIRMVALDVDPAPDKGAPTTQGERLAQETCERMDRADGTTVSITIEDTDANSVYDVGDEVTVQIVKPLDQLTFVFDAFFSSTTIDETAVSRLEQTPEGSIHGTTWTCAT